MKLLGTLVLMLTVGCGLARAGKDDKETIKLLQKEIEVLNHTITQQDETIQLLNGTVVNLQGTIDSLEGTILGLEETIDSLREVINREPTTIQCEAK